jgi:hypothetical protein
MIILIIVGQAGGNQYNSKGGGSNYLCLPNDPFVNYFCSEYQRDFIN